MVKLVLVCIGGALGSGARYVVATWAAEALGTGFPRGTLLVNLAGSFLIAVVADLSLRTAAIPPNLRLFLATGIMGGFTTYSSFNYETLHLLEEGAFASTLLYVAATVLGCLLSGVLGLAAARLLARAGTGAAVR
jgi:CrcB protein